MYFKWGSYEIWQIYGNIKKINDLSDLSKDNIVEK